MTTLAKQNPDFRFKDLVLSGSQPSASKPRAGRASVSASVGYQVTNSLDSFHDLTLSQVAKGKRVRANKGAAGVDKELEKRGHKFARYADDFTILVKSQRSGQRVLLSISHYLQNRLKLTVNTTKSHVVRTTESKFLVFTFRVNRIQWHPKTLLKFKQQVRRLTNRNWGVSMKYQLFKTSQYLRG
ncbi:hypothetical protein L4D77_18620 [Photobacterium frigidiphilum]|uniref:reverse transcriptase domain-containing protein n=1 Tax=Photobacterium frigidiphilum TaxID=264736 RepID=UPI003D0EDDCB